MIKDCPIIINNEALTVVDFDGKKVQLPSIRKNEQRVRVLYSDGKYMVVGDDYKEQIKVKNNENSKKKVKKTTEEQVLIDNTNENDIENYVE